MTSKLMAMTLPLGAADKVRIIQTNSAGDNVHVIDPVTNKVYVSIKMAGSEVFKVAVTKLGGAVDEAVRNAVRHGHARSMIIGMRVEAGRVVGQHQVEVGDVDVRLVPVDQRDLIRGHADVARVVGVAVHDAGGTSGEPRPRCPASSNARSR